MTNDERALAVEAAKALGTVVPEAYRDLLQPAAREFGQGLLVVARAVNVALSPLGAAIWGFDQIRDWLLANVTRKLSAVPADNIQTPPMQLAGQVLLNVQFVMQDEDLRNMYANLLASGMDKKTAGKAHPAYVSVLQQLSHDEARIVAFFGTRGRNELCWSERYEEDECLADSIAIEEQWKSVCEAAEIITLEAAPIYLDNLVRLRLLGVEAISTARMQKLSSEHHIYGPGEELAVREGLIRELYLTDFGARFIEACVLEPSARETWLRGDR